jgi:hypothetical protein
MPANPCFYHHAGGAVGIWGIITACTLVLRLADTVSMDERGGPQCFSLGSSRLATPHIDGNFSPATIHCVLTLIQRNKVSTVDLAIFQGCFSFLTLG